MLRTLIQALYSNLDFSCHQNAHLCAQMKKKTTLPTQLFPKIHDVHSPWLQFLCSAAQSLYM